MVDPDSLDVFSDGLSGYGFDPLIEGSPADAQIPGNGGSLQVCIPDMRPDGSFHLRKEMGVPAFLDLNQVLHIPQAEFPHAGFIVLKGPTDLLLEQLDVKRF